MTRNEVANLISAFLSGTCGRWDWDDFIHTKMDDPGLEEIKKVCGDLPEKFPPIEVGYYCSKEGLEVLQGILQDLSRRNI